jgi:hypothetical protein
MHLLRSVVALVTSQQAFVRRTAGGPTTMSAPTTRGGHVVARNTSGPDLLPSTSFRQPPHHGGGVGVCSTYHDDVCAESARCLNFNHTLGCDFFRNTQITKMHGTVREGFSSHRRNSKENHLNIYLRAIIILCTLYDC